VPEVLVLEHLATGHREHERVGVFPGESSPRELVGEHLDDGARNSERAAAGGRLGRAEERGSVETTRGLLGDRERPAEEVHPAHP